MRIDAHLHFWKPSCGFDNRPIADNEAYRRDFLPSHVRAEMDCESRRHPWISRVGMLFLTRDCSPCVLNAVTPKSSARLVVPGEPRILRRLAKVDGLRGNRPAVL